MITILIVDDSKAMRMIVMRTLKQTGLSGYTTMEAANGVEALEVAQGQRSGTDEAHVAQQHVQQLGKLVEAGAPQEARANDKGLGTDVPGLVLGIKLDKATPL